VYNTFEIMRLTILLILSSASIAKAWTTIREPVSMMGSRNAQKWENKKQWLAKRGWPTGNTKTEVISETCTIIGSGRIGSLLEKGGSSTVLKRGDSIPEEGKGPIFIATRNDSLNDIVDLCPENRKKDLVFLQNGYLDDFLNSKGLIDNTQVLLYLSVTSKDATPVDGITKVNSEGLTAATGEHAESFRDRLSELDLKCNVVDMEAYRPAMFEKLIWIATYMLVGAAKGCKSVGEAGSDHNELVTTLINELVNAVSAKEGITFPSGTFERLASYTDVVTDFPCAVKEFEWRNKYFYDLGDEACPIHNSLIREVLPEVSQ